MDSDNQSLGQMALAYARRGLYVFPCRAGGKEPATSNGCKDASVDCELIAHWWYQHADYNIGVATGARSHIFVLDVDNHDADSGPDNGANAEAELKKLEAEHGALPPTIESVTPRGRHIFFDWPGHAVRNSAGKLGPGLDIRGEGGYVVLPPSIHPSGRAYAWSVDSASTFAPPPPWLLTKIASGNGHHIATPLAEWRALVHAGVSEGKRNDSVARLAGYLLRARIDALVAFELLNAWNEARCQPPLTEPEITTIIDSIARAELKRRGLNGGAA
jgi:hypothetical protein